MRTRNGMVLVYTLLVVGVLSVLAGAIATLGSTSLSVSQRDRNTEQAVYAAKAGLAVAAEEYGRTGMLAKPYTGALTDAGYAVTLYENRTSESITVPTGAVIPPNTVYMVSTGTANGVVRGMGALFRGGGGMFAVGALAEAFTSAGATFDAYDSSKEPDGYSGDGPAPESIINGTETILATNSISGTPVQLGTSTVNGGVYVGPGGDPATLISKNGSTVTREVSLQEVITIPEIKVPAGGDGASPAPTSSTTPPPDEPPQQMKFNDMTITPPTRPGDPIVFRKYCFSMQLYPDGRFTAAETGSSSTASGNIYDKTYTENGKFTVSFNPFNINGDYHQLIVDTSAQRIAVEPGRPRAPHAAPTWTNCPLWLTNTFDNSATSGDPSVSNPATLEAGKYKDVTVNATTTKLKSGSTIVVENLTVNNAGKISLECGSDPVEIYVTGKLALDGKDTVLNYTRKAPNLKVYYTGTEPVKVSGGSSAYLTLAAPNAPIALDGMGSSFFGALVGKSLDVADATFHFDIATRGIGSGQGAGGMVLLARHRL